MSDQTLKELRENKNQMIALIQDELKIIREYIDLLGDEHPQKKAELLKRAKTQKAKIDKLNQQYLTQIFKAS